MRTYQFDNLEGLDQHFGDDEILDALTDMYEERGKHDSKYISGYYLDHNGDWWLVTANLSYSNGFQYGSISGPYEQFQDTVIVNKYAPSSKSI